MSIQRSVDNRTRYILSYGETERGQVYDGEDVKYVYTGTPVLNTIFAARLREEVSDRRIAEVLQFFLQRGVFPNWLVTPLSQPSNLARRLERHGFVQAFGFYGMERDLQGMRPIDRYGFRVEQVQDLGAWSEACCEGFDVPAPLRPAYRKVLMESGCSEKVSYRHYLGYWNGQPACTVSLVIDGEVAGVYWVSTIPSARRQGLGAALITQALNHAKNEGCTIATLQSTEMGHRFYKGLGFQDTYVELGYEWRP